MTPDDYEIHRQQQRDRAQTIQFIIGVPVAILIGVGLFLFKVWADGLYYGWVVAP